jgi:hypothetical protein
MEQFSDSLLSPPVALAMLIVSGILIVGGVAAIIAILTRSRTSITQQAATEEAIPETPAAPPESINGLANRLASELQRLTERLREEAVQEATADMERVRAQAELDAVEQVIKPAEASATVRSLETVAAAKQKADRIARGASEEAQALHSGTESRVMEFSDRIADAVIPAATNIENLGRVLGERETVAVNGGPVATARPGLDRNRRK